MHLQPGLVSRTFSQAIILLDWASWTCSIQAEQLHQSCWSWTDQAWVSWDLCLVLCLLLVLNCVRTYLEAALDQTFSTRHLCTYVALWHDADKEVLSLFVFPKLRIVCQSKAHWSLHIPAQGGKALLFHFSGVRSLQKECRLRSYVCLFQAAIVMART